MTSIIWHCHTDEQLRRLRATAVALQQVLVWSCAFAIQNTAARQKTSTLVTQNIHRGVDS